jgi:hypothetical protein
MITFLFWNIQNKRLETRLAKIVASNRVDIVVLAESVIEPQIVLYELFHHTGSEFALLYSQCDKLKIYSKIPQRYFEPLREGKRFTIHQLSLSTEKALTIVAAHLVSKLQWSEESQFSECLELARDIREVEIEVGHARTVLVGDLNMNPFESGIVAANGLHGVMTRDIALKRSRIVQGKEYPFFYNPMWGCLGDANEEPAGTFYAQRSEHINFFWNMFDQVLLRPDLLPFFQNRELKIVTSDGENSLVSMNGLPDSVLASDHLPILFRLNLQ